MLSRRDGTRVYYRLASEGVVDLWTAVRDVAAEHVAASTSWPTAYLGDRSEVEHVSMRTTLPRAGRRQRRASRRAARAEFRGRPRARCRVGADRRARRPRELTSRRGGGRGVLPRALLRLCRRRGAALAGSRTHCSTARCRLSRMATGRAAGRGLGLRARRPDDPATVPERRELVCELPVRLPTHANSRSSTRTPTS